MKKMLSWSVDKRNNLFLGMCLAVHLFLLVFFSILDIPPIVVLNCISLAFYVILLLLKKDYSERAVVTSYFEIIAFAAISTIILGRQAGFLLYIVGMISVVFYLAYSRENKRYLYQGIGCLVVITLVFVEPYIDHLFTEYKLLISNYARALYLVNLTITLITVVIISFLYAQEINRMTHEIKSMNKELDYKASHDQLTGLFNRHYMSQYIDSIIAEYSMDIVVAMIDIDDFKMINDQYGHGIGDEVIKVVSSILNQHDELVVARWGGEEFLVLSDNLERDQCLSILTDLHEQIHHALVSFESISLTISVTMGIAYGNDPQMIDEYIRQADELLYQGKNKHKNCIVIQES